MRITTDALYITADGREVCRKTPPGRRLYRERTLAMAKRQKGICCLHGHAPMCPGRMREDEISFEHENGRGGGKRDDRIEKDGKPINGAAHVICNIWKGSRRVRYNS